MKILNFIFIFIFCTISAQKNLPFDTLKLREVDDFFADDYGNIYLYKNKNFSLTKYDSLGKQKGRIMLTQPFKIQSVQNLLNIPAFSENNQELKFYDQNLNEIQAFGFRQKFGFIKMAYAENLQQIWLLDESSKRLIQYNFREDKIINSYPLDINFEPVKDILVYKERIYLLTDTNFSVYNFKGQKLFEHLLDKGKRLRRENDTIFITENRHLLKFENDMLQTVFGTENSKIVDKNSDSCFELKAGKLYLYQLKK
ncbi:hypothetical protein [uncultured Chryseobacterium sp.]|uniref:hypothetical protein n=1 Tax=uncultured Chryseobacterium sp. TaxID=259322 RepID=UPI00262B75CD|nr:hypothetical protein [uncultured Chryseobacterium sp.]